MSNIGGVQIAPLRTKLAIFNGISPQQTVTNYRDSEGAVSRRILRDSWQNEFAQPSINGHGRVTTPYRAVNGLGDYLSRKNYVCGGPNQVNADKPGWKSRIGSIISNCDNTGIPPKAGNVRYVSDSSNYTTFLKQKAISSTYNDPSFGGDAHNGSYVDLMAVRRR